MFAKNTTVLQSTFELITVNTLLFENGEKVITIRTITLTYSTLFPLNNLIISMTAFCNRVIDKALTNNKFLVTSYSYKSIGSVMHNETKYYPYSASFAFTPAEFSLEKYCRLKFNLVRTKQYGV